MHKIKTHLPDYTDKLLLQQNLRSKVQHNNIRRLHYQSRSPARKCARAYSVPPIHSGYSHKRAAKNIYVVPPRSRRWLSVWRIKINEQKCKHITFVLNRQTCPPLSLNNTQIPQVNDVTYLGVHLDRRLTWRRHIESKKVHLELKVSRFHWILNARSPLRLDYKVLLDNSTLKPIWTYGFELWGNASSSNIDIVQCV